MAVESHWEIDPANAAQVWDRLIGKPLPDPAETAQQVAVILHGVPPGERCLEIGAGIGRLMREIADAKRFVEVHGCDSSISMLAVGHRYLSGEAADRLTLSDGLSLPYPDGYFDFVFAFTVLQHMISAAMIHRNLAEVYRVLRSGGLCRIQTVKAKAGTEPNDLSLYDGRVMRDVGDFSRRFEVAGMCVESAVEGLTHPEHIWVTARKP